MEPEPHRHLPGDGDPLDAALGELHDLAELERSFADLDARIGGARASSAFGDDDPFEDLAAALRAHRSAAEETTPPPVDDADEDEDSASTTDPLALELAAEIEDHCQDALDALDRNDLDAAYASAMHAVRLDDEHPFPTFVLGLVAERRGDLDTARDMAELALRSAETNPDAIGLRAHIHVAEHQLDEADHLLRFGIAHNPDEAMLHESLARVSLARGRHAEALVAARAALRLEPSNPGALAVRAAALDHVADRTAVLAALRQGVMLHPEDPYSMVELASMEMEHGNLDRARSLLMRATRLAPNDAEIGEVRMLVDHVDTSRTLRFVPPFLRWVRDFPGGMAGLVVGLLVAALPLHALAAAHPSYRGPAITLVMIWAGVIMLAWLAPTWLTARLNAQAARRAHERLDDALAADPELRPSSDRIVDTLEMLADARDLRRIRALASSIAAIDVARYSGAAHVAATASRPAVRIGHLRMTSPTTLRSLVVLSCALCLGAPILASALGIDIAYPYGAACVVIGAAWTGVRLSATAQRRLARAIAALRT